MSRVDKLIQLDHLQRQAYIYIRQSTLQQVHHHQESERRQYGLQARALELGWPASALVVVDDDQGCSGQKENLAGFARLMEAVSRGRVGAILCLEVSRLSRRGSAWHALIELCAWQNTLLIDEEGIYDPNQANDRLILGIRGLVDENELDTLRRRMQISREEKARRGELRVHPPTGYCYDANGQRILDPDEEVQGAIRLFFAQFARLGTAAAVVRYFDDQQLPFPTRHFGGVKDGQLTWKPLTYGRALYILHDPAYAGAFTYGRDAYSRQRKPQQKQHQTQVRLPQAAWLVLLWHVFPGYITRQTFQANQAQLGTNRAGPTQPGIPRAGAAMLSGQVICGRCGRPLRVAYEGTNGQYLFYLCYPAKEKAQYHTCQRVPGNEVDQQVVQRVLEALSPLEIELSLRILDDLAQQQDNIKHQWQRRLERAQYEADLAQRRYLQVDPENRLVARSLEKAWEERLVAVAQVEQDYVLAQQQNQLTLSDQEYQQLLALAHDIPALWHADTTTPAERKALLRLLIADVVLTRRTTDILVQLRWVTNQVEQWTVPLPLRGLRTDPKILDCIRRLAPDHSDTAIAQQLKDQGFRTARGKPFTKARVRSLRQTHQISKLPKAHQPG